MIDPKIRYIFKRGFELIKYTNVELKTITYNIIIATKFFLEYFMHIRFCGIPIPLIF